jgi:hypothetical protein
MKKIRVRLRLQPRKLGTFDTVVKTLGGTARVAEQLGISSSYVSNWKRVSGKIPAKYYLILRDELAEMGFVPDDRVFNFAKRVRKKPRAFYCDFAESNVLIVDFRRRKTRMPIAA